VLGLLLLGFLEVQGLNREEEPAWHRPKSSGKGYKIVHVHSSIVLGGVTAIWQLPDEQQLSRAKQRHSLC
jgi:hypothetical protein